MNRARVAGHSTARSVPHACGDDSYITFNRPCGRMCAPRVGHSACNGYSASSGVVARRLMSPINASNARSSDLKERVSDPWQLSFQGLLLESTVISTQVLVSQSNSRRVTTGEKHSAKSGVLRGLPFLNNRLSSTESSSAFTCHPARVISGRCRARCCWSVQALRSSGGWCGVMGWLVASSIFPILNVFLAFVSRHLATTESPFNSMGEILRAVPGELPP